MPTDGHLKLENKPETSQGKETHKVTTHTHTDVTACTYTQPGGKHPIPQEGQLGKYLTFPQSKLFAQYVE